MAIRTARPSHLPISTSLRRIGRGRMASAIPDSMSLAIAGAATSVEPSASTPLNMKATKMVSWDAASRTCAGVTSFIVGKRLNPQLVSTITTIVNSGSASSSLRRDASRMVRRAMVNTRITRGKSRDPVPSVALLLQQLQKPVFEGFVSRLDGIDAAAQPDDLADQVRHPIRGHAAEGEPLALILERAVALQRRPSSRLEPGRSDSNRAISLENLRHRAGGNHPAVVDDRDAVTDLLDLGQEMRVEEHGGAPRLELPDDLADVVTAHRV